MGTNNKPDLILHLLNKAIAREMQVSIQYMLQHALWSFKMDKTTPKQEKFVGTHFPVWLPGASLKKIAITEMRHAESIAERIALLGGEPATQPSPITIGETPKEILLINKAEEESAIQLYEQIIDTAENEGDEITHRLFLKIISDEEDHLRQFSSFSEAY